MKTTTIDTLTQWEVYQIVFLVQRGWHMTYEGGHWFKEGKTREFVDYSTGKVHTTSEFSLDDAFYSEES